ncbi:MAG TPA: hypothetical protein VGB68_20465 [Pyrinomonadaceae bacterium]|jgi:hypothetical protein
MNEEKAREQKRLGVMFIAFALFQILVLLLATIAWMFLPWLGMAGRSETEAMILMLAPLVGGWAFSIISILLFVLSLVAGIGVFKNSNAGRVAGIAAAYIALLEIPFGTIFGVYALRRLKSPK